MCANKRKALKYCFVHVIHNMSFILNSNDYGYVYDLCIVCIMLTFHANTWICILDAYVNRVWEYTSNLSEITPANAEVISHGNELTRKKQITLYIKIRAYSIDIAWRCWNNVKKIKLRKWCKKIRKNKISNILNA